MDNTTNTELTNFQFEKELKRGMQYIAHRESKSVSELLNDLSRTLTKKKRKEYGIDGEWPEVPKHKGGRKKVPKKVGT